MIGVYTSKMEREGVPVSFFESDDATLLAALYKAAQRVTGPGLSSETPEAGLEMRRVGEVVVRPVKDDSVYHVSKPDVDRSPPQKEGEWAIQTLIFDKDDFTEADAKKWISDHEGFGNYGMDETSGSYRFRQYDPEHFSEFRTISIDTGISAAYGKVGKTEEKSGDLLKASIAKWEAVRAVNRGILARGIKALTETATINKAEDEQEERYVLSLVLEPTDGEDGAPRKPDTQNDVYSAEDVRKAAHAWMEWHGAIDLQHSWKGLSKDDVRVLECYIAPTSFTCGEGGKAYDVVEGTWMLGLRIASDELWKKVKDGEYGAYSIGGTALREPE